eukprot:Sspe_Gene.110179::Locus_90559_Transcript_1_2_Confidence_0.500_Length_542::g.110179::m.110179
MMLECADRDHTREESEGGVAREEDEEDLHGGISFDDEDPATTANGGEGVKEGDKSCDEKCGDMDNGEGDRGEAEGSGGDAGDGEGVGEKAAGEEVEDAEKEIYDMEEADIGDVYADEDGLYHIGKWEQRISQSTSPGNIYWYNHETCESVWDIPEDVLPVIAELTK